MTITCFMGVIVGASFIANKAFTDTSVLLEISENITITDIAKVISLFFIIIRTIDNYLYSALA